MFSSSNILHGLKSKYPTYPANEELLPKTPFISNKKVFASFKDKKKYHQEFEQHKLKRAAEVKEYLKNSLKCSCGKPALIYIEDPYDLESVTWVDDPDNVEIDLHYSCKDRKCLIKLDKFLKAREEEI